LVQEGVGLFGGGDGLGGEETGEAALPVEVLAFDLALGLWGAGIAQADAVEVKGSAQLGECVGPLREEEAVVVDVEFQGQTMFAEGSGQEAQVSQEVFPVEDLGAGADAGTVIQQIQEGILAVDAREPGMRGGVQLPEGADLEALPASEGRRGVAGGRGMSQAVGSSPTPHGGGIQPDVQTTLDLGGDKAVGSRRAHAQESA